MKTLRDQTLQFSGTISQSQSAAKNYTCKANSPCCLVFTGNVNHYNFRKETWIVIILIIPLIGILSD